MKSSQGSKSAKSRGVRCPGVKYTGGAIFKMMMITETPSSFIGFPDMQRVKGPPQCDIMCKKIVLAHDDKKMQIQAPRVFGVMLTEHLVQAGALVPPVLEWCCTQVDHFLTYMLSPIFLSHHHYDHQIS